MGAVLLPESLGLAEFGQDQAAAPCSPETGDLGKRDDAGLSGFGRDYDAGAGCDGSEPACACPWLHFLVES